MIQNLEGDCREILPTLPARSVHCALTSPPYYGVRKYLPTGCAQKQLEIGQERTPQEYIEQLVQVFRQVARVLVEKGTLWLNLGDVYAKKQFVAAGSYQFAAWRVKPGDLMGLPWRLAFSLQADGWYLRSDIIWHRPNVKPESVTDRPTHAHEYLFLLSRTRHYYYDADAIREPVTSTGGASFGKQRHSTEGTGAQSRRLRSAAERNHPLGKNKRSVWRIPTRSFPGAHFAVFPPELVKPCILAGCPRGCNVLDCFAGSGTTGVVAESLDRNAVLIELNPAYVEMQKTRTRLRDVLGNATNTPTTDGEHGLWLWPEEDDAL